MQKLGNDEESLARGVHYLLGVHSNVLGGVREYENGVSFRGS